MMPTMRGLGVTQGGITVVSGATPVGDIIIQKNIRVPFVPSLAFNLITKS